MSRPPAEWLPRQHGAWAMLLVPALVGAWRAGPAPIHALLGAVLFVGYFAFNAAGLALRARRHRRLLPVAVYGVATAALGVGALAADPTLARWLPPYVLLALVSLAYSRARNDRALGNDAVTIAAASLMAAVMAHAAGGDPNGDGVLAWIVGTLFAYFFGTALYVKTVIRERTNATYHRASVGYHVALAGLYAAAIALDAPARAGTLAGLSVFFLVLAGRAALLAGRRVKPLHVGLGEIAACVVLTWLTVTW